MRKNNFHAQAIIDFTSNGQYLKYKNKAIKPEKYHENNNKQLDPTACKCRLWQFCICKFLPVPKPISGPGPHSFYNLFLTALLFSSHLDSTIAYFQMSSRAMEVTWTNCSLFAGRDTQTYREHNLHMIPWGLRKGHCMSLLKSGQYSSPLS